MRRRRLEEYSMRGTMLAIALILATKAAVAAEKWPQFRGPQGDGHAGAAQVPVNWSEKENIRWKTPIPGRGWSSPVIWGDQIWMTTATPDGKQVFAVCVDRETGRIVHHKKVFDIQEPREIHKFNSYASPTPVIEQSRVYVHFGSYGTACLDTRTAETLWKRRDLQCDHYRGPGSSPILFGDSVIVHFDGFDFQYVVALDKTSGETVWKTDRSTEFGDINGDFRKAYSTPLVVAAAGRRQLLSPGSKAVMSYDPLTGEELWRVQFEQFSGTARPVFRDGMVFISTGFSNAHLWAVRVDGTGDVTDSHVAWKVTARVPSKPSPLLIDDMLFMVHDGGVATCLKAASGEEVWRQRIDGNYSSSPVYAGGRIYFFNHEGAATVIQPGTTYQRIAVNRLDHGCWASPAVVGNALFVRTEKHLYRIEE